MKVATIYGNFKNKGGAQNMALSIAEGLCQDGELPIILTKTPLEEIHNDYKSSARFLPFTIIWVKKLVKLGYRFISHDRKSTTKMMLIKALFCPKMKIVHVSHSTFDNLRWVTLFPEKIIAISSGVSENLQTYFKIPSERIKLIHNGVADWGKKTGESRDLIKILFVGRICKVKRQLEVAEHLKGHLPQNVVLTFAGAGEDGNALSSLLEGETNMYYIGEINLEKHVSDYDYIMLFSEKEGLPLTLIESCMSGKPMLTNNLASVLDVNEDKVTGFIYATLSDLITDLPNLPLPGSDEYKILSDHARAKYENCFSVDTMIAEYVKIVQEL